MLKKSAVILLLLALSFLSTSQYAKASEDGEEMKQNGDEENHELSENVEEIKQNDNENKDGNGNDLAADEAGPKLVQTLDAPIAENSAIVTYPKAVQKLPDVSPDNNYDFIRIFAGLYYQNSYRHINNYLVDKVDEKEDVVANLKAATEWYEKERLNSWNIFNKHLVGALEQFTALNRILEGEKCTRNSYAILLKNDRATSGKTHKARSKLGPFYRVERVIYQVAMDHAIVCKNKYPQLFEQKYAQLDKESIERVEALSNDIINQLMNEKKSFFRETKKFETFEQLQHVKTINGKKEAQIAYDALKLFARQDSDVRYLKKVLDEKEAVMRVNRDKFVNLFKKYLVEPCAYYVRELGPDIFIPASYDIIMFDKEDRYEQNDDRSKFFLGWIRYKLCGLLIGKDQKGLIKSMIKIASKENYQ